MLYLVGGEVLLVADCIVHFAHLEDVLDLIFEEVGGHVDEHFEF